MIDAEKYPQLAKMEDAQPASQAIGEFLDWLGQQGIDLCGTIRGAGHDRYAPITEGAESLMARHFGIDLNAVERERRAVLAAHVSGVASVAPQLPPMGSASASACGCHSYESEGVRTEYKCDAHRAPGVKETGHQTKPPHTPMD